MYQAAESKTRAVFKVVDLCRTFFSKTGSDTFRSVLIFGKEQKFRKKCFR